GFSALALHGDMDAARPRGGAALLANRSCNVLVASDVAARGFSALALHGDMDAARPRGGAALLANRSCNVLVA
ncbi:hypothetical protein C7E18_24140, partial [Stenotrophomonas maltophilia]